MPHGNADSRIGGVMHVLRHARALASHDDHIIGLKGEIGMTLGCGCGQQNDAAIRRFAKFRPGRMANEVQPIEIIHSRAPHTLAIQRKTAGLYQVERYAHTGRKAHHGPCILRNIGLEEDEAYHG